MGSSSYLDSATPLAFAHRGGALVEPNVGIENSLRAFQHAFDIGYRYFETDVRATKDGIAVACHDEHLTRLSGHNRAIVDVHSEELAQISLGGSEQIVPLADLLAAFPRARFNIDIKSDDAVAPTLAMVREYEIASHVCLASFDHARLLKIRELAPEILTSTSTREAGWMVTGVAVPETPRVFQVPVRWHGIPVVTRSFVRRAHRHGKQVHVWTIDEPEEMHRLLDLGVDGIMTDRTDLLKDVLLERGQWKDHE